jgi:succinate dehydrogenase / fumarate reductase cytochrome b subunit
MKATKATQTSALAAKSMGWLGTVIFVFILIHLYQFWLQMKLGNLPMANYDGVEVKDLYTIVTKAFRSPGFVVFYVASMAIIGYHLYHGFYSAFQTLGLQHRKYTPLIRWVGRIYSIAVPLGFASIPVYLYGKASGWW